MGGLCGAGSIHEAIAAAAARRGFDCGPCRGTRVVVRDGYCVGRRLLYDECQAAWELESGRVEIRDRGGNVLATIDWQGHPLSVATGPLVESLHAAPLGRAA